jgi:hypothetical protein
MMKYPASRIQTLAPFSDTAVLDDLIISSPVAIGALLPDPSGMRWPFIVHDTRV